MLPSKLPDIVIESPVSILLLIKETSQSVRQLKLLRYPPSARTPTIFLGVISRWALLRFEDGVG